MRQRIGRVLQALVIAWAAAAAGCYEADVAIDPSPLAPNDPHLMGTWRCVGPSVNENAFTITMAAATPKTFAITFQETGEAPEHLEGFVSDIKGTTFLNVHDTGKAGPPRWNVVRAVLLRPDVVELRVLEEALFEKVPAAGMRKAIERELKNPKLFDDRAPIVCVNAGR